MFAVAALGVLAAGSFAFRVAVALPDYMAEFADRLKGQPLPALTMFVFSWQRPLLVASILLPVLAVLFAAFARPVRLAGWLLGGLLVFSLKEGHVLWSAILVPYHQLAASTAGK